MPLRRFLRDRNGGVAPLLALSIIPIVGAVGAAVDYGRANVARSELQAALDATALTLAKQARTLSGDADSKATDYFNAVFHSNIVQNVALKTTVQNPTPGNYVVDVTASGTVPMRLSSLFGGSGLDVSATSEAVWGIKKLNLALALDNTGSMADNGKMDALKTAAHNLLATLQTAVSNPGDIQVSIVPFTTDVNVGTANVAASWIDWTNWEAANGSCSSRRYTSQSTCTSHGYTWTPAAHSTWNGCVYDRDQNNDVSNTATVSGSPATMFRAHQATGCPTAMMPLSDDWNALNAEVDAMSPNGNTNVTIGVALAWQTLSAVNPFNAPADAPDLEKVLIVLTDGENTQNRWTSSATSIDSRTAQVCAAVKADNVKVYTVRVIDGNASLLQSCATNPNMYYDVDQADQLDAVFSTIAQNLANLRLTK